MSSTFWSNTIWYVLLGVTSVISIVFILYKSNNRKFIIGFSFSVLGALLFVEACILAIFNAYNYFPKISNVPFVDSIIGNYFSQFSIAITTVLIIVYNLSFKWNFILAATYYFIEELFLKLGIYQHLWYKSWYTFIGIFLLFWLVKKWYNYMFNSSKHFIYHVSVYAGASALFSISTMFYLLAFSLQVININFNMEFFKEQDLLLIAYRSILIIIMIILYGMKLNWKWNGMVFVFLFIIQYILSKIGIMTFKDGWFLIVTLLDLLGSYFEVVVMYYLLSKRFTPNTNY